MGVTKLVLNIVNDTSNYLPIIEQWHLVRLMGTRIAALPGVRQRFGQQWLSVNQTLGRARTVQGERSDRGISAAATAIRVTLVQGRSRPRSHLQFPFKKKVLWLRPAHRPLSLYLQH